MFKRLQPGTRWRTHLGRRLLHAVERRLPEATVARIDAFCADAGEDPFGLTPHRLRPTLLASAWLYHRYFRVTLHAPPPRWDGPAIVVANHGGQLPFDGAMIATAVFLNGDRPRICRTMVDHLVPALPVISDWFAAAGQVPGTPANALRLLSDGQWLLVFPEGKRAIQKTIAEAYRLLPFGTGFARLALRTKVPVIPAVVVGAEEQYPTFHVWRHESIPFDLGIPLWAHMFVPVLGLLPLPVKYHLWFGDPVFLSGDPDGDDDALASQVDALRAQMQQKVTRMITSRRGVFR